MGRYTGRDRKDPRENLVPKLQRFQDGEGLEKGQGVQRKKGRSTSRLALQLEMGKTGKKEKTLKEHGTAKVVAGGVKLDWGQQEVSANKPTVYGEEIYTSPAGTEIKKKNGGRRSQHGQGGCRRDYALPIEIQSSGGN